MRGWISMIKTAFWCVIAYMRLIISGSATRTPREIGRLFVSPAGKLGDVVCTTPVLYAIRQQLPRATIILEDDTRGTNAALLADSSLADEYMYCGGFFSSLRKLRAANIDAAIITGPNFLMLAQLFIAGIPCIVAPKVEGGFSPQYTSSYRWLLSYCISVPYVIGAYAPRERLRVLEPLGVVSSDTKKHLGYSKEADIFVTGLLQKGGISVGARFACISPSAGNKIKDWPAERFASVAEHVFKHYGFPIVVIGTSRDEKEVAAMLQALPPSTPILNLCGQLSLDQLKAFIAKVFLFISVDTGPLYIAEAFDVPTIDITGPIDEREQPPIGPRHRVVVPPQRERPQLFVLNARVYDEKEALRQVLSIEVENVTREIDNLMTMLG